MSAPGLDEGPRADVMAESSRLISVAAEAGIGLRLLGGVAIRLRIGDRLHPSLRRTPKDIDMVAPRGSGGAVAELLQSCGYRADERFNLVQGASRMLFFDRRHARQLDLFVGSFEMCHVVPIAERLLLEPSTLPLAELVLTKLQIVELNEKDRTDLYALLHAQEVDERDGPAINAGWISSACARDWGLYHTSMRNLERLREGLGQLELDPAGLDRIATGIARLEAALEAAPKTAHWRLRAKIGERLPWYQEPDEVELDR
jgi:hypothetical protein